MYPSRPHYEALEAWAQSERSKLITRMSAARNRLTAPEFEHLIDSMMAGRSAEHERTRVIGPPEQTGRAPLE